MKLPDNPFVIDGTAFLLAIVVALACLIVCWFLQKEEK